MIDTFSESEQKILSPFFTNMDKNVFVLVNMPEVIKGTLFSRYSRSDKSVRRILLDEFITNKDIFTTNNGEANIAPSTLAKEKAEAFYDRVLVGYGDDSVAELAGAHIACEAESSLVGDILTDSRIGISPLEKSARYVLFDKKVNGRYLWYREPRIMASEHSKLYEELMNKVFDRYAKWIPVVIDYVKKVTPRDPTASDRAFDSACRAKACDILKNMLTASRLTNIGLYGNGRAYEYLITKLYSAGLTEATELGHKIHDELAKVIPSFVKRAQESEYIVNRRKDMEVFASTQKTEAPHDTEKYVKLVDYEKDGEEKVLAAMLYQYSHAPLLQLRQAVKDMDQERRKGLIHAYLSKRRNRRDKAGRALENTFYTFEVCSNYGMFRDLHRHRALTIERQMITASLGYDVPEELRQVELYDEYKALMEEAKGVYSRIAADMPIEAQYAVPRSFHIRYYMKMNLREVYHLAELRSQKQGHPDYRKIAQKMKLLVDEAHPTLSQYMQVDMNEYALARIESEKRIDEKMARLKEKEKETEEQGK